MWPSPVERLAHTVDVRQIFGGDFGVNLFVGVRGIWLGVELEAFDALTPKLELQAPHVKLGVVAFAITLRPAA